MKFKIGDIVKKGQSNETLIILATKEFSLTIENLKEAHGELFIVGIEKIAKNGIQVQQPYDYIIGKIESYKDNSNDCILDDHFKFQSVFEDDLTR